MKKTGLILLLTFAFFNSGKSARVISNFDIARWYLDADLVLICNVTQTDTIFVGNYDSLLSDGFHLKYDILREQYLVSIDSVIKGSQNLSGKTDTIFTPEFYSSLRYEKKEFSGMDEKGDSTFIFTVKVNNDVNDNSYFRIKSQEKRVVMLRKNKLGYVIDYQSNLNADLLNLIQEVKTQGEDYFNMLASNSLKQKKLEVYPNPFTDIIQIKGVKTERIEIIDMNGKKHVYEDFDQEHIDLSYLKPGVHFLTIFSENNKWTQKIIKE